MAEVLTAWPERNRKIGHRSKYARYLDGQIWRVNIDDVPVLSQRSFRMGLDSIATKLGFRVRCHFEQDGKYVVVQVAPRQT